MRIAPPSLFLRPGNCLLPRKSCTRLFEPAETLIILGARPDVEWLCGTNSARTGRDAEYYEICNAMRCDEGRESWDRTLHDRKIRKVERRVHGSSRLAFFLRVFERSTNKRSPFFFFFWAGVRVAG